MKHSRQNARRATPAARAVSALVGASMVLGLVPGPGLAWAWERAAGAQAGPAATVAVEDDAARAEPDAPLAIAGDDGPDADATVPEQGDGGAEGEGAPLLAEQGDPDAEPDAEPPIEEQDPDATDAVAPVAEEPAITLQETVERVSAASKEDVPDATMADQGHLIVEMAQDDPELAALCAIDAEEVADAADGDAQLAAEYVAEATGDDPEQIREVVENAVAKATESNTEEVGYDEGDIAADVRGAVEDAVRAAVADATREAADEAVAEDAARISEAAGMQVADTLAAPSDESCGTYLVDVPDGMPLGEARARLLRDPGVKGVYYDYLLDLEPVGDGEEVASEEGDAVAGGGGAGDSCAEGTPPAYDAEEPEPIDVPDPEPPAVPADDLSKVFHNVNDPSIQYSKWEGGENYLDFSQAWQTARDAGWRDSSNVTIAVIDTGVQTGHPDLKDNIVATHDATGTSGVDDVHPNGHGTKVAGIASARTNNNAGVCSLAYNANLLPIQVAVPNPENESGVSLYSSNIVKALDWLLTASPQCSYRTPADFYNVRVVNLSIAAKKDQLTESDLQLRASWVRRCWEHGIVIVNSIGNARSSTTGQAYTLPYESATPCVAADYCVGVINLRRDGETGMARDDSSNYNVSADDIVGKVSAPGTDLLTTNINSRYAGKVTGTSAAAPEVASLLALMFSVCPTMTPEQATSLLYGNTKEVTGGNPTIQEVGYGMIDPVRALQAVIAAKPSDKEDPDIRFVDSSVYDVPMGETAAIRVTADPGATPVRYVYEMYNGDTDCATVDEDGRISPVRPGTIHVGVISAANAYYKQGHRVATIHVIGQQTISAAGISMPVGTTRTVGEVITPRDGHGSTTYHCSDTSVATVDSTGRITPHKAGTATLTIKVSPVTVHGRNQEEVLRYGGTQVDVALTVTKAANPIAAKAAKAEVGTTYSAAEVRPTACNVTVANARGAVTYANASDDATARGFSVDGSTGAVTAPAGTKAGAYTVKVRATAAGDESYEAGSSVAAYRLVVGRAANPIAAKATKAKLSTTYSPGAAAKTPRNVTVTGAAGAVTYANASAGATAKGFAVDKATGRVTVPKATRAGTYTVKVRADAAGDGNHEAGSRTVSYKIAVKKAKNPISATPVARTASLSRLKAGPVTVKRPLKVSGAAGKVTYAMAKKSKYFAVNASSGKVTIRRGTKRGTHELKIKVTAAGNKNYKAGSRTVTCKITVR